MTMKLSNLKSSIHYATLQRIAEISFAFGAGLSFFDILCDIAMILEFYKNE